MADATLTFDDEFNSLDYSKWSPNYSWEPNGGYYSTTETWDVNPNNPATASLNPFSINNGVLTINASPTPDGASSSVGGSPYTSGILTTDGKFSQTYGYFEMRAQFPSNAGFESDFWMLPTGGSSPELDAVELPSRWPSTTTYAIHSSDIGGNGVDGGWADVADSSNGFHTYGVDWEPDKTTWYVDGKEIYQTNTPANLDVPEYMILDLQAGAPDSWPGSPSDGNSGQLKVDYIRAYTSMPGGDSGSGSSAATTTATTTTAATTTPASTTSDGTSSASTDGSASSATAAINPTTAQVDSGTQSASLISPTTPDGSSTDTSSAASSSGSGGSTTPTAQDLGLAGSGSAPSQTDTSGAAPSTDPTQTGSSSATVAGDSTSLTNYGQSWGGGHHHHWSS